MKKNRKISTNFNKFLLIFSALFLIFSHFPLLISPKVVFAANEEVIKAAQEAAKLKLSCSTNPNAYPWCKAEQTPGGFVVTFYQIALGLVGGAALGVMIYGAILYTVSAGNTSKQQEARSWITGAIWGLALLLAAYLILYTINPDLVKIGQTQEFLNKLIKPVEVPKPDQKTEVTATAESLGPQSRLPGIDVKKLIEERGVQVKPGVVLDNMRGATIDEVRILAGEYFSFAHGEGYEPLVVTAGTECGGVHNPGDTSHCAGYKVDFRAIPKLDQFIKETNFFKYIGIRSDDGAPMYSPYWDKDTIYAREKAKPGETYDHWDVRVTRSTLLEGKINK